jgi:hypothetical protein
VRTSGGSSRAAEAATSSRIRVQNVAGECPSPHTGSVAHASLPVVRLYKKV